MAAEQIILVDGHDQEVGVGDKLQTHIEGALHRAFSIFIFDAKRRLLLQKRAKTKYHSGGLWSNTCCGHPRPGESTEAAAHRRLKHEMSFDCELREAFDFLYRAQLPDGLFEHEYDHVLVGEFDGDPVPNATEVEDWKRVDMSELRRGLRENPDDYSYWLRAALETTEWQRVNALMRVE